MQLWEMCVCFVFFPCFACCFVRPLMFFVVVGLRSFVVFGFCLLLLVSFEEEKLSFGEFGGTFKYRKFYLKAKRSVPKLPIT